MRILNRFSRIKSDVALPSGSVSFFLLADIAFKNLFYKKLRTTLTIGGVIIGVGAVIFLLAFGFGLRDVVSKQVVDSSSIRTIDVNPAKANLVTLDSENIGRIKRTSGVVTVAPVYYYAGKVVYAKAQSEAVVYGAGQEYLSLTNFKRIAGKLPNFNDNPEALFVSSAYVKSLGETQPEKIIGKELTVTISIKTDTDAGAQKKDLVYKGQVAGVIENGSGSEVYMSDTIFTKAGIDKASQLKVLVGDKKDVPNVQKKIESLGFTSTSPLQTLDQINQIFGILNIMFLGFGGIGLIIAILGMFNTLTISLLERTKEIGLMIALGARSRDIRRLFVIEAVGLAVIGGTLGIAGAYLLSFGINYVLNRLAHSRGVVDIFSVFSFPSWLILSTIGFSALLGLLVVYLPARRAARINPIEALKSS